MQNDEKLELRQAKEDTDKTDHIKKQIMKQKKEEKTTPENDTSNDKNENRRNNNSQLIAFFVFKSKLIIFTETQFLKNRRNA